MKQTIFDHIVIDPDICHGKPTFAGTRIMVWQILEMLSAGETAEEILQDYPALTQEHIRAALRFAASVTERTTLKNLTPHEVLS